MVICNHLEGPIEQPLKVRRAERGQLMSAGDAANVAGNYEG
ncbi:MAG: hypothetical protein WC455_28530 [Dehalococcoidia bacterium]